MADADAGVIVDLTTVDVIVPPIGSGERGCGRNDQRWVESRNELPERERASEREAYGHNLYPNTLDTVFLFFFRGVWCVGASTRFSNGKGTGCRALFKRRSKRAIIRSSSLLNRSLTIEG